jgi:excisionase family DNA binding protein
MAEAAAALGVSRNTLRHWSDAGNVRCYRSPGGHRRYRRADIQALLDAGPTPGSAARSSDAVEDTWRGSALDSLVAVATRGSGTTSCCVAVPDGDEALRIVAAYGDGGDLVAGGRLPLSALPVEAEVLHGRRRLHIPDVARTGLLARTAADEYCRHGLLGLLALPIELGDGGVGVLRLGDSRGPHSFDQEAMTFAELMARHAGILLSEGPSQSPAGHGRPGASEADGPVGESPGPGARSGAGDLASAARAAVGVLGGRPDLDYCTVYLLQGGRARALASSEGIETAEWDVDRLPSAAAVIGDGRPALLSRDDERLSAAARTRDFDARGITGILLAPIAGTGGTLGVIEAGGADLGALRSLEPLLRDIAALLSATLRAGDEHTRLEGRERDLGLLEDIWLRDTSHLSSEQVLRGLVERLATATRAPIAEIYTVEGDTAQALVSYDGGHWDGAWEDVVLRLARYPTSLRAVETGEAVMVNGLDDEILDREGRFSLERWGYQAHLSLPLIAAGRVLGLLELYDYVPHDFSPDLELARGVARVAALTLDNERIAEEVRRRSRTISELEAIAGLCASIPHAETLVAAVAARLQAAMDAASCQVFVLTPRGVLCVASHDRSGRDDHTVGLVTDLADYPTAVAALNAREVLVISSLEDDRLDAVERAAYRANGWMSELCVPLVLDDELSGYIDILDSRSRELAEYVDFARSVAGMVAVALEAARLRDESAHRRADLDSLTAIGGLDVAPDHGDDALERLAAEIRRRLGAADCDIFSLDEKGLHCLVSVDERGRDHSVSSRPLTIDHFPSSAQAVRSGEIVVVPDLDDPRLSDHERADMATWGFVSEVCVPLVAEGRVRGVMDVFDRRARDFAEHTEYLQAAGHVAAGIVGAVVAARKSRNAVVAPGPATESDTARAGDDGSHRPGS